MDFDLPADLVALFGSELNAEPAPEPGVLAREAADGPVVLLTSDTEDPAAAALVASGARVITTPAPPGAELLSAVAVMNRLRSPGGCPWDAAQTHDSLRQYLVEETYELLDAIADADRVAMREELGDVLLQVLFHARVAAEASADPFTIDDVAGELVAKLVGRHPHVFVGDDPAVRDAASQERRWDELKRQEKKRQSSVDGVAFGQPAVALAAKLVHRATRAGLPDDLLPSRDVDGGGVDGGGVDGGGVDGRGVDAGAGSDVGTALFALAARAKLAGVDPEDELRSVALRFAADVRTAERAARESGFDPARMVPETWRAYWPTPNRTPGA